MTSTKPKSILVYDAAEGGILGKSWATGAKVFRGSFDEVVAARSPEDLYALFRRHGQGGIKHLQIWGHGSRGAPLINKQAIGPSDPSWSALEGGTVWFRSCHVMAGIWGAAFVDALIQKKINVAGHLGVIGTWGVHSYLVALNHEAQAPWWPIDTKDGGSAPWLPRTVTALTMKLPAWAFKPSILK